MPRCPYDIALDSFKGTRTVVSLPLCPDISKSETPALVECHAHEKGKMKQIR